MKFRDVKITDRIGKKTGFEMAWNLLVTSHKFLVFLGADFLFCGGKTHVMFYIHQHHTF